MRLIAVIFFLPILVMGQGNTAGDFTPADVSQYLTAYSGVEGGKAASFKKVFDHLNKVSEKRPAHADPYFLSHVFAKTHNRFLKNYKTSATFNDLFKNGNYNCLTGTALYALILEHLGYDYRIIETNYHIFLLVETSKGEALIETTDPLTGFVTDAREISSRISRYMLNTVAEASNKKTYYQYHVSLYNAIGLENLTGLLHYNIAVNAYNSHDFTAAVSHLESTRSFYHSKRIEEFSAILLTTLGNAPMDEQVKEDLARRIQSVKSTKQPSVATISAF
jgi:hypothetical protein